MFTRLDLESAMIKLPLFKLALIACLAGTFMSASAFAQGDALPSVVGEVTSVIGVGRVLNAQNERAVARGGLIRAGDRIETAAGGHVHVRFIDGGLVSVRPLSRLHIEDYRNQDTQNLAAIKFKLDVGVMRSVTGEWGEAHRDRFRLNTPVAAIGIKGTDFVVKADSGNTFVSVKTGAIVMSPLEGACALGLGPCAGERSALLSADMQGQMLEYLKQNDKGMPRLVPYVDLLARNNNNNSNSNNSSNSNSNNASPATAARQIDNNLVVDATSKELNNQVREVVAAVSPVSDTKTNSSKDSSLDRGKDASLLSASTQLVVQPPIITPPVAQPADLPLVWLHNAQEWNVPKNTISMRFDEASAAGRNAIVGNFFINLYRDETITKVFTPPATTASFNLLNASANFAQPDLGGRTESVSISGAKLSVDFARSTLATQMDLTSPALGTERFAATAAVTRDGIFTSNTSSQQLAGAFSTNAGQAGYVFEKRLSTGTVSGLTLWGR